jgi:hypothetical protein
MIGETIHRGGKKGERGPKSLLLDLRKKKDKEKVEVEPDRHKTMTSL